MTFKHEAENDGLYQGIVKSHDISIEVTLAQGLT